MEIRREHKDFIIEALINNNDVRFETNDQEFKYEPKGQSIEVGLVKFLIDNEIDVANKLHERNKSHHKLASLPFDQELKRMTTIRQIGTRIVVYTKGAPEVIIKLCDKTLTSQFNYQTFQEEIDGQNLNQRISDMAAGVPDSHIGSSKDD